MGRRYTNPPIIEAVCEFRLTSDSQWDLTIPGLIYEELSSQFPHKEQRVVQEVQITGSAEGVKHEVRTGERIVFFADDRKTLVQVGPHLLTVNRLKPYPRWEQFEPNIERAFRALTKRVEVKGLERIGLRYINRIEMAGRPLELDDYFEFRPFLGRDLPQTMDSFLLQCLLPFSEQRDSCKIVLTTAVPEVSGNAAVLLDLGYYLARPRAVAVADAMEWVKAAHEEVERVFEACLTERLRKTFGEVA